MTAYALSCFIFLVLPQGMREILSRVYYSLKDTKSQMLYNSIALLLNILLNLIFVRRLGLPGLALATVISVYIGLSLSVIGILPRLGRVVVKDILKNGMKILLLCAFPSIVTWGIREIVTQPSAMVRLSVTFLPALCIMGCQQRFMHLLTSKPVLSMN